MARRGVAWPGPARHGYIEAVKRDAWDQIPTASISEGRGLAGRGMARIGRARRGGAGCGMEVGEAESAWASKSNRRIAWARLGRARRRWARFGEAWRYL